MCFYNKLLVMLLNFSYSMCIPWFPMNLQVVSRIFLRCIINGHTTVTRIISIDNKPLLFNSQGLRRHQGGVESALG